MTRGLTLKGIVAATATILSFSAHATVPAGTQLPLKATDRLTIKGGELKKVKFRVPEPESGADPQALLSRLAGCTVEGDAVLNPRNGRLYVKRPVLTCSPETKVGTVFMGGDISGQLSDSGLEGIPLECASPKQCTIGSLKKDAEAAFTVTETLGGSE